MKYAFQIFLLNNVVFFMYIFMRPHLWNNGFLVFVYDLGAAIQVRR